MLAFAQIVSDPPNSLKVKPKLASDAPVYGNLQFMRSERSDSGILFAIDESKGTGKGYDTIYLDLDGNGDLSHVQGCVGAKEDEVGGALVFHSSATIPITRIAQSSSSKNSVAIDIVLLANDGKPVFAESVLRGCFVGEVDSSAGKIPFKLIDNGNMRYDAASSLLNPDNEQQGDSVAFDWGKNGAFDSPMMIDYSLSGAVNVGGKLYELRSDADGSKLEVRTYTGPTARLGVKLVKVGTVQKDDADVEIAGKNATYQTQLGAPPILVPAGIYRVDNMFLSAGKGRGDRWNMSYSQKKPLVLPQGKTLVIPVGGDLIMSIAPGSQQVVANAGSQVSVPFAFTTSLGGTVDRLQQFGAQEQTAPIVQIKNSAGKVVLSGKAEFG
jgi:hypothetical protein